MKKKITRLMIFASAGAISLTGQLVNANDAQFKADNGQANTEFHGTINEPSGAERTSNYSGQIKRASDLIGTDVRNEQNEKIGEIKDFGVDLQSGRVPYTVISSGGFFGVGDRMLAIPSTAFAQSSSDQSLVLNMDKQRLKSAPTFDKNHWPSMEDRTWGRQVYTYYGQQPYWETTTTAETYRSPAVNEPSGSQFSNENLNNTSSSFNETTTGLSRDRSPRQGLGAEDLTRNEERINNPGGYAESDSFSNNGNSYRYNAETTTSPSERVYTRETDNVSSPYDETPAGLVRDRTPRQGLGADDLTGNEAKLNNPGGYAERNAFVNESAGAERNGTVHTETKTWSDHPTTTTVQMGKIWRATDLIGLDVRNSQNERVGEVKDVVLDLHSGRVAYALVSAGGFLGMGDKLYAVPPTIFTRGTDDRTLIFNVDKETLKASPSFEKNDWAQANNQKFTLGVYQYYHQQPYWQNNGEIREPSGSQQKWNRNTHDDSQWQKGNYNSDEKNHSQLNGISSGNATAAASRNAQASDSSVAANQPTESAQSIEPERAQNSQQQNKGTAAKESAELNASTNSSSASAKGAQVQEPAGATTGVNSTQPATSDDQAGSSEDRDLAQRVRTTLQSDTTLSSAAPNVKVSAANGKITLRGTVSSEQEKQSFETKAQEIAGSADKVNNQLEVKNSTNNTTPNSNP